MKGSVRLPVFIDDARKYVNTTQLRAKYLGASYEAEYCQWQTLHGLGSLMETASLIITPNAYLEGKLIASYPPDPIGDFDVTRATTATRVNSAGLVELVPYNLLQYSQQFTNAIWTPRNGTFTDNFATAPDGTLTASRWVATDTDPYVYQGFTGNGGNYVASVYVKGVGSSIGKTASIRVSGTLSNFTITGEWQRVQISTTISTSVIIGCEVPDPAVIGDTIYIWGFQLVEGSVAKDYQKTETRLNIPRLDYSNGTCPSLLVEPQRTNLLLWSEQFDDAIWDKSGSTISANATTSPDGTQNADKFIPNNGNQLSWVLQDFVPSAGIYTYSIYVKSSDFSFVQITGSIAFANEYQNYNIANGTLSSYSGAQGSIQSMGNGWYRLIYTLTASAMGSARFIVSAQDSGTAGRLDPCTGNGTKFISIWGAQLEAGSYATSYIPTTSASVTRNADVISKTGISSLIGQTEGTLFCEVLQMGGNTIVPFQLSDTTNSNRAQIEISGVGAPLCVVSSGGVNTAVIVGSYVPFNEYHKIAVTYKANEFKLYVDGTLVGTDTSGAVPISLTAVYIGSESGTTYAGFEMKSAVHWKQVLTNDQLIALTTI